MDDKHKTGEDIKITEPEDLLLVVEKMKSIPRITPSRMFSMKVTFFSIFPTLWLILTEDNPWQRISEKLREPIQLKRENLARYSTAAAVALIAALLVFSGLTMAAKDSNPGDFLYSFKRARESIEMAFTFDPTKKVEKTLAIAECRLDELDHVIKEKNPDPGAIREVINDYNLKIASVDEALKEGKLAAAGNIEAHLSAVETAENNLEKRLAAAGPAAILAPAENARVVVSDSRGKIRFGDNGGTSASGETDGNGEFSFTADVESAETAGTMEVAVEADGRTALVPAFYPEGQVNGDPYQVSVSVLGSESAEDGQDIVLENGLVTVSAGVAGGDIISGSSRTDSPGGAGKVTEPSLSSGNDGGFVGRKLSGPRLVSSSPDEATYEVSYKVKSDDVTLTKTYKVTLEKGLPYASLECTVDAEGAAKNVSETAFDVCRVPFAGGAGVEISGSEVAAPDDGHQLVLGFNRAKPYAEIDSGGGLTFISSPAGPGDHPESWVLGKSYIQMRPNDRLLQSGSTVRVSAIIAPDSSKDAGQLEELSSGGAGFEHESATGGTDTPDGFIVTTEPCGGDIKSGMQRFTITVYKEYDRLLD